MAIIKQLDKRSGITYVYESTSYWDKEKQQPRSKRKLIGRLDPDTGEILFPGDLQTDPLHCILPDPGRPEPVVPVSEMGKAAPSSVRTRHPLPKEFGDLPVRY